MLQLQFFSIQVFQSFQHGFPTGWTVSQEFEGALFTEIVLHIRHFGSLRSKKSVLFLVARTNIGKELQNTATSKHDNSSELTSCHCSVLIGSICIDALVGRCVRTNWAPYLICNITLLQEFLAFGIRPFLYAEVVPNSELEVDLVLAWYLFR